MSEESILSYPWQADADWVRLPRQKYLTCPVQ